MTLPLTSDSMARMSQEFSRPEALLNFVCQFIQTGSPLSDLSAALEVDGSLRFDFILDLQHASVRWSEHPPSGNECEILEEGAVKGCIWFVPSASAPDPKQALRERRVLAHIAERLRRLLRGSPPALLQWRNRNPEPVTVYWSPRLFARLGEDLMKPGDTRYYDYTLTRIDEYEGFINLAFESRSATVVFRLLPTELLDGDALMIWGPMAACVIRDERSEEEKRDPRHAVEAFFGYVLSRLLPPVFSLAFEGKDPPAGYMPPDFNIDMVNVDPPDSSSLYEMIFATSEDVTTVTACDRECFNMFSFVAAPKESWITNTPWRIVPSVDLFSHVHNIHLSSEKTVMGSEDIDTCLTALRKAPKPPGMVVFIDSCISRMMGDDLAGPISRFRKNSDIPLVQYEITLSESHYLRTFRDFWKRVYLQTADPGLPPEPGRVCLLGVTNEADGEIVRVLRELGVTVGSRLFPSLTLSEARELNRNALVVINEWDYIRVLFSDMLEIFERPRCVLPLPYGIDGSLNWYKAVCQAAGVGDGSGLETLPVSGRAREAFDSERRRMAPHRIGIFLRLRDTAAHLGPQGRFGVPFLSLLRELGLGVDLNLFADSQAHAPKGLFESLGLSEEKGDSLSYFEHWKQLPGLIRQGDFSLVYTETFRDQRVTSAGKVPLGLHDLQPGFLGAAQTMRRVRLLAGSGFFARYGRFLRDPYAHYRHDSGS